MKHSMAVLIAAMLVVPAAAQVEGVTDLFMTPEEIAEWDQRDLERRFKITLFDAGIDDGVPHLHMRDRSTGCEYIKPKEAPSTAWAYLRETCYSETHPDILPQPSIKSE